MKSKLLKVISLCTCVGIFFGCQQNSGSPGASQQSPQVKSHQTDKIIMAYRNPDNQQMRLVDKDLHFVDNMRFDYITDFNDNNQAIARTFNSGESMASLIDKDSNIIFDANGIGDVMMGDGAFNWDLILSKKGHIHYTITEGERNLVGIIDANGKVIMEPIYIIFNGFYGREIAQFINPDSNRHGLIDEEGKIILEDFDSIYVLNNNYVVGKKNESDEYFALFNRQGDRIIEEFANGYGYGINEDYCVINDSDYNISMLIDLNKVVANKDTIQAGNIYEYVVVEFNGYFHLSKDKQYGTVVNYSGDMNRGNMAYHMKDGKTVDFTIEYDFLGAPSKDNLFPYILGNEIGLLDPNKPNEIVLKTSFGHNSPEATIHALNQSNIFIYKPQGSSDAYFLDRQLQVIENTEGAFENMGPFGPGSDSGLTSLYNGTHSILLGPNGHLLGIEPQSVYYDDEYVLLEEEGNVKIIDKYTGETLVEGQPKDRE